MPEIKHRQINPNPGVEYGEIHIPDDRALGTGSFKIVTKPNAFVEHKAISSIMINVPVFQISVNFNPAIYEIPVLLGYADGSEPKSMKIFLFPVYINIHNTHEFIVTFNGWQITEMRMDEKPLRERMEWELPYGTPIPEHQGNLVLTIPGHSLPCEVQEAVVNNIFDLTKVFTFYQVEQGNTQINIYRSTDFQIIYRHYNPSFGERELAIDFTDAERTGARAFFLAATWSPSKNQFIVGLIHHDPKFEPLREAIILSEDKLKLIRENIISFEEILNAAGREEEAHQFLKNNEIIMGLTSNIEPLSKLKLGDEYVTDFVIREIPDGYIFIEIERPGIKLFKKTTPPDRTYEFNHAIQQLENWKAWIARNHSDIAAKLPEVSPRPICWLIAGRSTTLSDEEKSRLAEINEEYKGNYKIFTYDDLLDRVKTVISKIG